MKSLKKLFVQVFKDDRAIIYFMIGNFVLSVFLFVVGIANLRPNNAVVKIAYGDVGGYVDGKWTDMLVFPVLAVLFGVVHSALFLRIYEKYGKNITIIFIIITMLLIIGALFVLFRLLGEG